MICSLDFGITFKPKCNVKIYLKSGEKLKQNSVSSLEK